MLKIKDVDFMDINREFTDEERMVKESVRKFVDERFLPHVEDYYNDRTFPLDLVPEMGKMGLLGCNLDGYGCTKMSSIAYGLVQQELEAGDAGLRSFVSVQSSLFMYAVHTFGSEQQKEKWLPKMAAGEGIGCFGLTEPDFGSNPAGMRTRAVKTATGYKLTGAKCWITNGCVADVAVVWAKLDGEIRGFLVEKDTPGFIATEIKRKLSFQASITAELSFDNCEIPEDNILPKSKGLKSPLSCLMQARFGVAWGALGAATACFNEATQYTMDRIQFHDAPLAGRQLIQVKLADMYTEITKAQWMTLQVSRLKDRGELRHQHISMIKMNNTEMALDCARKARTMLGGNGISSEFPIMRHLCNTETVVTYEGTTDIHKLTLGRDITGIAAF
ncbi:MAG: acyl-CoA dehydrogenase family protein [Pseudomonadales bacterium]|nr:acyl-CoA dehydrogenase family protein [Pseudomonadales bacterium]